MAYKQLENGKNCTIGLLFSGENKVVIPDMQREYCWARTINPITGDSLVYNYIQDIVKLHTSSPIRMGLIYAYQAPQTFIQLCDGQQRITTLYLLIGVLHKILLRAGDEYANVLRRILISEFEENSDDKEPRLQYAIRESTLWFTRDLVNQFFLTPDNYEIISSNWYFEEYNLDPSIQNIVDAISMIQKALIDVNQSSINALAHFVVEKITFLYYDMGNRRYGEDQFVVINTTGVGLSKTENIKPKLMATIEDLEARDIFSKKWEKEWEQFFWDNLRPDESKNYTVDEDFNEFLRWVFVIEMSGQGSLSSEKGKYTPAQKALDGDAFNIFDIKEGNGLDIAITIDQYLLAYKYIVNNKLYPDWLSIQRNKDNQQQAISQIDALKFLPLLYMTKDYLSSDCKIDEAVFKRAFLRTRQFLWGRSQSRNISRASIETAPRAILIVQEVCKKCRYDIARYTLLEPDESRFFTVGERIKYNIYLKKEELEGEETREIFEDTIWGLEHLKCCLGNITFAFDALAKNGIDSEKVRIEDLITIEAALNKSFENPKSLVWRSLLTYGNYALWIGSTPSLNAWKYSYGDSPAFYRNILLNNTEVEKRNILVNFLSDAYKMTVDRNDKDSLLLSFMNDRISNFQEPNPDTLWKRITKALVMNPNWFGDSDLGRIAIDEGNQICYVLKYDRSSQGYKEVSFV